MLVATDVGDLASVNAPTNKRPAPCSAGRLPVWWRWLFVFLLLGAGQEKKTTNMITRLSPVAFLLMAIGLLLVLEVTALGDPARPVKLALILAAVGTLSLFKTDAGGDLASPADLMGHESVETTKVYYAVFEQDDLRRKHDQFSESRWTTNS